MSTESNITIMKVNFTHKVLEMYAASKSNSALMSRERYENLIRDVNKVKVEGKKAPSDYWLMKHYNVLKMQGVDKLIYPLNGDSEDTFLRKC